VDRKESRAYRDTGDTRIGRIVGEEARRHSPDSGVYLLPDGPEAFIARLTLIELAERGIDAQYYLLEDDATGRAFILALLKAADRGVRVRLLVDDINLESVDDGLVLLDAHPNFSVRVFNPFARNAPRLTQLVGKAGTLSRRMHNKALIGDNQLAILGGRNIGDAYFDAHQGFVFDDLDVLLAGPAVGSVSTAFDSYWNHSLAWPINALLENETPPRALDGLRRKLDGFLRDLSGTPFAERLRDSPLRAEILSGTVPFGWDRARVIYDHPEKLASPRDATVYHLAKELEGAFEQVRERVTIISPYFVPGKEGVELFRRLRNRGIQVRILTNSLSSNDVPAVHAGYASYRRPLLEAGVELFELNANHLQNEPIRQSLVGRKSTASLHAKAFIFDRESILVGSLNLDPRSLTENTEIGVLFRSPRIAGELVDWFDSNIDTMAYRLVLKDSGNNTRDIRWYQLDRNGQREHIHDPGTSIWLRIGVSLLALLPVEPLL
jgi:putative cardiolipin synthase